MGMAALGFCMQLVAIIDFGVNFTVNEGLRDCVVCVLTSPVWLQNKPRILLSFSPFFPSSLQLSSIHQSRDLIIPEKSRFYYSQFWSSCIEQRWSGNKLHIMRQPELDKLWPVLSGTEGRSGRSSGGLSEAALGLLNIACFQFVSMQNINKYQLSYRWGNVYAVLWDA